jgi:hypothetical protein
LKPSGLLVRKGSEKGKGKGREEEGPQTAGGGYEGWRSPVVEAEPVEMWVGVELVGRKAVLTDSIETPQMKATRDPETGRKMINQYLVSCIPNGVRI